MSLLPINTKFYPTSSYRRELHMQRKLVGPSVWISTQQFNYWLYTLHFSNTLEKLYPWSHSIHFLTNLCNQAHTSSSQHICSWRHLLFLKHKCFWWGIEVHQLSKSSWNPTARHYFFKELHLARFSEFTPRKKLVYDRFQKKESGLCNLRKNFGQNLKFIS